MPKSNINKISPPPTANAYAEIRRRIVELEYAPGLNLDEKSLVEELGMSRTPVREALIRLAGEGLIDLEKNKGAKVSELDLMTLQSIFEAGDLIERAYTRLACLRRDDQDLEQINEARLEFAADMKAENISAMVHSNTAFHLHIAAASRNKYFLDCYRRILADHERIAQMWYTDNFNRQDHATNENVCKQHDELYAAIKNRDAARAEKISVEHASYCKEGIRTLLSSGEKLTADLQVEVDPL